MGFYISKLKDTQLNEYIGSQTMYSMADNGAFDCEVSKELNDYVDLPENINIMSIVDKDGINSFLQVLKSGVCKGRDIEKIIKTVEENYTNGFMVWK